MPVCMISSAKNSTAVRWMTQMERPVRIPRRRRFHDAGFLQLNLRAAL